MRKRNIERVILAGMSSNLCVEAHMRELIERGFEVNVVSDATAGGVVPDLGDGYESALINFRYIATSVLDTDQALEGMGVTDASSIVFEYEKENITSQNIMSPHTRMALQFKGQSTHLGTLSDVTKKYGITLTPELAFGQNLTSSFADDNHLGCFESEMLDPEYGIRLGRGIDCLWTIDGGVAAVAFFDFGDDCGLLVHAGTTSLGSFAPGVGNGPIIKDGPLVDTISGAAYSDGVPTILSDVSTGAFAGITGKVRISGALNMGDGETPFFNCIMEIELDSSPTCGLHDDESTSHFLTDGAMIEAFEASEGAIVIEEKVSEKVYENAGHAWVKFHSEATHIGGLEEASALAGIDVVTLEDCFNEEQRALLGDSLGCHSVDLKDFLTERVIGTGIDCLWGVEGGVAAVGWFITDLGVIVNSGFTSLVPFGEGVGQGPVSGEPDHPLGAVMSGSFPPEYDADTFVVTTGMYEGVKGNIRLSGMATPGEPFYFNCIWDIYMKYPSEIMSSDDESGAGLLSWNASLLSVLAGIGYYLLA